MVVAGEAGNVIERFLQDEIPLGCLRGASIGISSCFAAISAIEWLDMARIVRGQVMSLKKQEFIEAAVALGLRVAADPSPAHDPQHSGIVIIYGTLIVPTVMLLEAFLSFLGFSVQPPMSSGAR